MVLSAVLEALRGKRQAAVKSTWKHYQAIVSDLTDGKQVDVDALAVCLDTLDKSDSDLEVDIENLRKRRELAALRTEHENESKRLPKLEADLAAAKQELQDAIDALQPKVDAAAAAWNACYLRIDQTTHATGDLINSCVDPEILAEEAALNAERQPLVAELRIIRETQKSGSLPAELSRKLSELDRKQAELNNRKLKP